MLFYFLKIFLLEKVDKYCVESFEREGAEVWLSLKIYKMLTLSE